MDEHRFKVYDEVWVMRGNRPTKLLVFAVIESMAYWKVGTELSYRLVGSRVGAGWGNDDGEHVRADQVFATSEDLIYALGKESA